MKKHFAMAFVAVSALLATSEQEAFAQSHKAQTPATTHKTQPHPIAQSHKARAIAAHRNTHTPKIAARQASHHVRPLQAGPAFTTDSAQVAWVGESGKASYYSSKYNGRRTSSGAIFNQQELTAAHPWLPFGTKVKVVNADNGRSVVVTVTDRLYTHHRVLDMSRSAAEQLGIIRQGVAHVSLQPV
jgi:rare lipoprotein A